jgi:hypothetical protein
MDNIIILDVNNLNINLFFPLINYYGKYNSELLLIYKDYNTFFINLPPLPIKVLVNARHTIIRLNLTDSIIKNKFMNFDTNIYNIINKNSYCKNCIYNKKYISFLSKDNYINIYILNETLSCIFYDKNNNYIDLNKFLDQLNENSTCSVLLTCKVTISKNIYYINWYANTIKIV